MKPFRLSLLVGGFISVGLLTSVVVAAPPGSPFDLGESLDPACAPGDTNCTVVTPAASGQNSDITSLEATTQIGLGKAPDAEKFIDQSSTDTSFGQGTYAYNYFNNSLEPSSDHTTDTRYGIQSYVSAPNTNTNFVQNMWAIGGHSENYGTGDVEDMTGVEGWAYNAANATITDGIWGGWFGVENDDGSANRLIGLEAETFMYGGSTPVAAALRIDTGEFTGGTITDKYAILIEDQNGTPTNGNYGIYQAGADEDNYFAGSLGIGVADPAHRFHFQETDTSFTAGTNTAAQFDLSVEPSSNMPTSFSDKRNALVGYASVPGTNTNDIASVQGIEGDAENYGTGSVNLLSGLIGWGYNAANAAVNYVYGGWSGAESDAGTVQNLIALGLDNYVYGGTVTNWIGLEIESGDLGGGTVQNRYGIWIKSPSGSTTTSDYGIYQEGSGQDNYFAGEIGLGVTAPSNPIEHSSGAVLTAGGTWTDASSRELKQDIHSLSAEEALTTLQELDPVHYAYKADPDDPRLGFIAEDVPALVATPDRKNLSSMDITAILTKALQEMQRDNAALKELVCQDHPDNRICQ